MRKNGDHTDILKKGIVVDAGQVASTGMVAPSYVQKVAQMLSQKEDGCVAGFLEECLNVGLNFILSAEVDHKKKTTCLALDSQMRRKRSPGSTSTGDGDSFLKTVYSVEFEYSNNKIESIPIRKEEVFLSS
ncbi:hypothetical protein KY289_026311 [Solanum tuberosum]|nr:hypothetical protein KY289_026311 [Solanum tuberosum]